MQGYFNCEMESYRIWHVCFFLFQGSDLIFCFQKIDDMTSVLVAMEIHFSYRKCMYDDCGEWWMMDNR